jgi:hypothetical protein
MKWPKRDRRKYEKNRREKLIKDGVCYKCGKKSEGNKRCPECNKKARERRVRLLANGKCYCGRPLVLNRKNCELCLLRGRISSLDIIVEDRPKVEKALAEFNGICPICGRTDSGTPKKNWSLDHNHRTKRFRDILCYYCNMALGIMQDDPRRLRAAAEYLEFHDHQ